ncbi:MAG: putative transporter [Flavobacterium sp.]|jgi:putative transport protein|nr:putative transporter [Flavobacterium sp.]HQV35325.1 putative transporter [Flavobacterium sp.]
MFEWFYKLFVPTENPDITQSLVVVMIIIGIGVFVGRLKIGKVSLGVSAVMFAGLFLGHFGYRINGDIMVFIRDLGLILFVYGIGIQVGPSFFSSFRKEGLKFNILAVSTVLFGALIAVIIYLSTQIKIENVVGLLSGSVTNTPGLGAAKSVIQEYQNQFPEKIFSDPTIAYAITYPMGVLGVILVIILSKAFLKIDINIEKSNIQQQESSEDVLIHQKCRITKPEFIGKSIYQILKETDHDKIVVSRLKHSGSKTVFSPTLDTKVEHKDVIMLVGTQHTINDFIEKTGKISTDLFIESEQDVISKSIFVTHKAATHKKLAELDLYNKYDLKVTRVYRSGKELLASPSLELFYGDKLRIVGNKEAIQFAEKLIGNSEKKLLEPDFLSLFGGLLIGIIIGSIPILIPSLPVPIKLGFAAGPLIAALLISRYGGIGGIHSYINTGAIYFMKDLGVCLFFAAVGIHAGESFYANFVENNGWLWLFYGSFITFIPLVFMVLVGHYYLKINFLQLSGLLSGTYTDPAALSFSGNYLDSDVPTQAYATVYPLVTLFRIFTAQFLILLLM